MFSHGSRNTSAFWATGLMLFALFFGAGNLIFPALLGQQSGTHVFMAMAGFLLTGAGLPLLGILAIGYSGAADVQSLASRVSPWFGLILTVLLYLTIGPLFAMPRTATVSFEVGIVPFLDVTDSAYLSWALALFSVLFFGLSYWLALSPGKLVDRIGKILTPLLLLSIAILVGYSALHPMGALQPPEAGYAAHPVVAGMIDGYNTMDGIVSPIYAMIVIDAVLALGLHGRRQVLRMMTLSGMLAVFCLAWVYVFIAYMGANSVTGIGLQHNGALVLAKTALFYFGNAGKVLLAIIVFLACLTTAIGLITACAAYFHRIIPRISYRSFATVFTLISCLLANKGLEDIIRLSLPVLMLLYPLIIVLILLAFLHRAFAGSRVVYVCTMVATLWVGILDAARLVFGFSDTTVAQINQWLPLYAIGMGWVIPATIGFMVGWILHRTGIFNMRKL
ncbi:MAG: branched-chain amino acid transport system II carrier protein [Cardiobacteriaceae bacterium]|nr:branched-chain amino acid transport system II carrier protein [Cardiobacteriaceae bacterium]